MAKEELIEILEIYKDSFDRKISKLIFPKLRNHHFLQEN